MTEILRVAGSLSTNVDMILYDKSAKNTKTNFLVEVTKNGRTTFLSKHFIETEEANKYFDKILINEGLIEVEGD